MSTLKKASRRISAAALAVAGAIAMTTFAAAPASAAERFVEVCSFGNYESWVAFPDRGWLSTGAVPAGRCASTWIGTNNQVEAIQVFGKDAALGTFTVTAGYIRARSGGSVKTFGTFYDRWAQTPAT